MRASRHCDTLKRFLPHPTRGSSAEANGFPLKNAVSIVSDHLFFCEGEFFVVHPMSLHRARIDGSRPAYFLSVIYTKRGCTATMRSSIASPSPFQNLRLLEEVL